MVRWLFAAALALSLLAPSLSAQSTTAGVLVATDPAGDAGFNAPTGTVQDPSGRSNILDLVSLTVAEQTGEFDVHLGLAAVANGPTVPGADTEIYDVHFNYGGVAYELQFLRGGSVVGGLVASLAADKTGGDNLQTVDPSVPAHVDDAAKEFVAALPRLDLLDSLGAPAFAGQLLQRFWVESLSEAAGSTSVFGVPVTMPGAQDRMPDAGVAATDVPVLFGVHQTGHAHLSSPEPFRSSNGENATFRYLVHAENLADQPDTFTLGADDVPAGWTVRFPETTIDLGGQANTDLTVLADVPFAHLHGTLATFQVSLQSKSDPGSTGRILLGIYYTQPPQPAGHHDTLTLHSTQGLAPGPTLTTALGSAAGGTDAYMNAFDATEDQGDVHADVPPSFQGLVGGTTQSSFTWLVPLRPGLALGLDLNLSGVGELKVPVSSQLPMAAAVLTGSLGILANESDGFEKALPIATIDATPAVDVGAGQTQVFDATLHALPAGDYVPYKTGQNLWLSFTVTFMTPEAATGPLTPVLKPGGTVRIPLLEYRDHLTGTEQGAAAAAGPGAAGDDVGAPSTGDGHAHKSPGLPFGLAALGLVGLALLRRRR